MRLIIRHNPSGKYICSKYMAVYSREMARKFNSMKQAGIFLSGSCFKKEQCSVIEYYRDQSGNCSVSSESEICSRILNSMNERR